MQATEKVEILQLFLVLVFNIFWQNANSHIKNLSDTSLNYIVNAKFQNCVCDIEM